MKPKHADLERAYLFTYDQVERAREIYERRRGLGQEYMAWVRGEFFINPEPANDDEAG